MLKISRVYKTSLTGKRYVADGTLEVSFQRPDGFNYKAGQYIQIGVEKLLHPDFKGKSRVFSMVSSPTNQKNISVAFRTTGTGFKKTLEELPIGSPLLIEGPHGYFTISEKSSKPLVFLAGGIGITPYMGMIRFASQNQKKYHVSMILFYANTEEKRAAYVKDLREIEKKNKNFILKEVYGRIDEELLKKEVPDIHGCIWHISGPPIMVDIMRNILFNLKILDENICYEEFVGY